MACEETRFRKIPMKPGLGWIISTWSEFSEEHQSYLKHPVVYINTVFSLLEPPGRR